MGINIEILDILGVNDKVGRGNQHIANLDILGVNNKVGRGNQHRNPGHTRGQQ